MEAVVLAKELFILFLRPSIATGKAHPLSPFFPVLPVTQSRSSHLIAHHVQKRIASRTSHVHAVRNQRICACGARYHPGLYPRLPCRICEARITVKYECVGMCVCALLRSLRKRSRFTSELIKRLSARTAR